MDDSFWCITLLINTHCAAYTQLGNYIPHSNEWGLFDAYLTIEVFN